MVKKLVAVVVLSSFLGACATGPVGGPPVEDLSLGKDAVSGSTRQVEPVAAAPQESPTVEAPRLVPIETVDEAVPEPLSQPQMKQPQLGHNNTPVATPVSPLPEADQQVVESLLREADGAKARADSALAIMKLQQAQRIAPREPKVYARLAALYLSEGEAGKAEQLARKGLTLVAHSAEYSHYFWRVIAACRRYQGDVEGEEAALKQARQFK